jgi:OPA family sugar phosphate sensor protein UhpC-like MFS transporter
VARRYRALRRTTFLAVTGGYAFYYVARMSLSVAKKPLIDAGIADAEELGRVGAVLLATYAVGKFVNGVLADRAHVGRFIAVGLLASAAVNLLFGWSASVLAFTLLWAANGWFQSMGCAPSVVNLNQWFGARERGTRYSLWSTAHSIGEGLSFFGIAAIAGWLGWRYAFWTPGVVCLVVGVVLFRTILDRPRTHGLPPVAEFENEPPAPPAGVAAPLWRVQLGILRLPAIWILGLASASLYVTRYGLNDWLVLYLQDAKGCSLVEAGATTSLLSILGVVGIVLAGTTSDVLFGGRRLPVVLCYGVVLVGSLVGLYLVPPGHPWWDRVLVGAAGFAVGGVLVFVGGLIAVDLCPREATGAAMGFVGLLSYLGASVQDWVSGTLIESTRYVAQGEIHYRFEGAFRFWIGAAVLSVLLTLPLGLAKRVR